MDFKKHAESKKKLLAALDKIDAVFCQNTLVSPCAKELAHYASLGYYMIILEQIDIYVFFKSSHRVEGRGLITQNGFNISRGSEIKIT